MSNLSQCVCVGLCVCIHDGLQFTLCLQASDRKERRIIDVVNRGASSFGIRSHFWLSSWFHPDHRHTFHHTHHPLSTHLPLPQRLRKRVHSMDRRRKKKRKKKKTSLPPSDVTPTIHEVDEEEAQSDTDGQGVVATPTEPPDLQPQVKWDFLGFSFQSRIPRLEETALTLITVVVHVRILSS